MAEMNNRHVLFLGGLVLLTFALLTMGWEFVLEDLVWPHLLDRYEPESLSQRWGYVISYTCLAGLALIVPTLACRRAISERDRTLRALLESEARFRAVIDNAPTTLILKDIDGRYRLTNRQFTEWFGGDEETLIGKTAYDFIPKEQADELRLHDDEVLKTLSAVQHEHDVTFSDGSPHTISVIKFPVFDDACQPIGVGSVSVDITERKLAEGEVRRLNEELEQRVHDRTEELAESEARFRNLIEGSLQGIVVMSAGQRRRPLFVNPAAVEMLGYDSADEILALGSDEPLLAPHELAAVAAYSEARLKGADFPTVYDAQWQRRDGSPVWLQNMVTVVQWDGEPAFLVAVLDVTDRRHAEKALKDSEERFRRSFEDTGVGMVMVGLDGRFQRVNRAFRTMLGHSEEGLLDKTFADVTYPDDVEIGHEVLRQVSAGKIHTFSVEKRYVHREGHIVWASVSGALIRDSEGNPLHNIAHVQDITDRKRAEEEAAANRDLLVDAIESIPDGFILFDSDERLVLCNTRYREMYPNLAGILDDPETRAEDIVSLVAVSGQVHQAVGDVDAWTAMRLKQYRAARGTHEQQLSDDLWVQATDRKTKAGGIVGVRTDISERKRAEAALRLTQFALDHAGDTVFWLGESGRFEYINRSGQRLLGYSWDELSAMHIWDVDPAVAQADWPSTWARTESRGPHTFEAVHLTRDGSEVPVEVTTTGVSFGDRQIICGFSRDIAERKRADEALRSTTETLEAIFEASPVSINTIDMEGRLLTWNPASEAIFGWREEEVLGKFLPYMPESEKATFRSRLEVLFQGQTLSGLEVRRLRKDGTPVDVSLSGAPLRDGSGRIVGAVGIIEDITERKRAEEALRESEARLSAIIDNSPLPIILKDLEGRYLTVNRRACDLFGVTEEECRGKTVHDFFPEELARSYRDHERRVVEERAAIEEEFPIPTTEGDRNFLEVKFPILDASGEAVGLGAITADITERKRAEEALRESEERFRSVVENAPMALILKDRDGKFRLANRRFTEWFVGDEERLIGSTAYDYVPKEQADKLAAQDTEVLRTLTPIEQDHEVTFADGSTHWTAVTKFPVFGSAGQPMGVGSLSIDITERKQAEEALKLREEQLSDAQRIGHIGHWSLDIRTKHFECSEEMYRLYGLEPDSPISLELVTGAIHEEDRAWAMSNREAAIAEKRGYDFAFRIQTIGGEVRFVEGKTSPIIDSAGDCIGFFGVTQDVTERKRAENALRENEQQFRALANSIDGALLYTDADHRYRFVNKVYADWMGLRQEDFIGRTMGDVLGPEVLADLREYLDRALSGERVTFEMVREFPNVGARNMRISYVPSVVADGEVDGIFALATDITDLKEIERALHEAKESAELANRAKSEFLANMSHELRTPLNAIIGFSDIIANETFGPVGNRQYKEYGGDICASGTHLLSIINDLLDLSKIDAGKIELEERELDVGSVVDAATRIVTERANFGELRLELQLADSLPGLYADERSLKQILLNLLSNAVKFTPEGGQIAVRAEVDAEGRIALSVEDTGIGIAEEDLPDALAPFGQVESSFTRKHDGTGLGLPLVQRLVELHGGTFELQSSVGNGTKACVRFPTERTIRSPHRRPSPGGSEIAGPPAAPRRRGTPVTGSPDVMPTALMTDS